MQSKTSIKRHQDEIFMQLNNEGKFSFSLLILLFLMKAGAIYAQPHTKLLAKDKVRKYKKRKETTEIEIE